MGKVYYIKENMEENKECGLKQDWYGLVCES